MKPLFYLLGIVLIGYSCSSSSDDGDIKQYSIEGTWYPYKRYDEKAKEVTVTECDKKNVKVFLKDGVLLESEYRMNDNNQCINKRNDTVSYSLDKEQLKITRLRDLFGEPHMETTVFIVEFIDENTYKTYFPRQDSIGYMPDHHLADRVFWKRK